MIITIDGPVASGKTTIGRALAKRLGYYYVYSGLLYRGLAYLLMQDYSYSLEQLYLPRIEDVLACLNPEHFHYSYDAHNNEQIYFDDKNITPFLKDNVIDQAASILSTNLQVREEINKFLRQYAQAYNIVIDGRDAGTVVFPNADMKFFLTADVTVRMNRWLQSQAKQGNFFSKDQALESITARDKRDQERICAPLCAAQDAITIDNSHLTVDETIDLMLRELAKKFGEKVIDVKS